MVEKIDNKYKNLLERIKLCSINNDNLYNNIKDLAINLNNLNLPYQTIPWYELYPYYLPYLNNTNNYQKITQLFDVLQNLSFNDFKCLSNIISTDVCVPLNKYIKNDTLDNINTLLDKYNILLPNFIEWWINMQINYTDECGNITDGKKIKTVYDKIIQLFTRYNDYKKQQEIELLNKKINDLKFLILLLIIVIIILFIIVAIYKAM